MTEKRHPISVKYSLKEKDRYGRTVYSIKSRIVHVDHTRRPEPGERALMIYNMGGREGVQCIVGEFKKIDGHGCSVIYTDYGHKFRQKTDSIWPVVDEEPKEE